MENLQSDEELDLSADEDDPPSTSNPVSTLKRKHDMSDEDSTACKSLMVNGNERDSKEEELVPDRSLEIPDDAEIDKHTCRFCRKTFTRHDNMLKHMRTVHKVTKKVNTFIRCIACNTHFQFIQKLRDHLQAKHKMRMDKQELQFPNLNAFKKWKREVERKELCIYSRIRSRIKTLAGYKSVFFCHRTGKYEDRTKEKRKRMLRTAGTCKLGFMCTAAIACEECPDIVNVSYYSHHYGHGQESTFVQLSEVEQNAIQENISNGLSYENLLDEMRENRSKDLIQVGLIKNKDVKVIKNAFNTEEYNSGLSDAESVDRWVRNCCQMEDSPVLYYKNEAKFGTEEQFILIMMTEFQKHILLSSDKQILCLDSVNRNRGLRFYLTCLVVLDECEIAFPVAFCISNTVDKAVIKQFLISVRDSTGPLSCTIFISDSDSYYHKAWLEVMNDQSKWLWSMWFVDKRIKVQLKPFRGNVTRRTHCYRTMREILECQNVTVFETMFKNYIDELQSDSLSNSLGNFILQKYGNNKEMWAYCYHKEIKHTSIIHLETLHRTMFICCREGRKKRLDKFIFVIMKLVRFKMLDRLTSILDEEKISLSIDAINMCHNIGMVIPSDHISSLSDKIWLVRSEDEEENVYVVRDFDSCPDLCGLKCSECDICVHMYSCSCMNSMINANLCQHIHAVVWKFLTPHFSPMPSPAHGDDYEDSEDNNETVFPSQPWSLFENVLKRTHDVYKQVRSGKCMLSEEALKAVMKRQEECMDICLGKIAMDKDSINLNALTTNSSTQTAIESDNLPDKLPQDISLSQYVSFIPNNLDNEQ